MACSQAFPLPVEGGVGELPTDESIASQSLTLRVTDGERRVGVLVAPAGGVGALVVSLGGVAECVRHGAVATVRLSDVAFVHSSLAWLAD